MNLVDGRELSIQISNEVIELVRLRKYTPRLLVVTCDPNFETRKFLSLKQAKAESFGIKMNTKVFSKETTTEEITQLIKNETDRVNGIIVQLPLPKHIDTNAVLRAIPKSHDVDRFDYVGEETDILPPVIGAIDEITKNYNVTWKGKRVVIFGQGRLVGEPAILYAKGKGAVVTTIDKETINVNKITKEADIIVLGVGKPNLLTVDMVKDGVIIFDAGASEDGGVLVGDASRDVASKAALLTPVPRGIGPMTVVLLFRNLLKLCSRQ